jgi:hypothetical protein
MNHNLSRKCVAEFIGVGANDSASNRADGDISGGHLTPAWNLSPVVA